MKDLLRLLATIKKRRKLFIGDGDLMALSHLVTGYYLCLQDHGIDIDAQWRAFDDFVHNMFGIERDARSLWYLIIGRSKDNDEAFDMFFRLLEQYCQKNSLSFE